MFLEQKVFRSVKSMHMRQLFVAFFSNTVLANQVEYFISVINSMLDKLFYFLVNGDYLLLANFPLRLRH